MKETFAFDGRVAVVTGATGGIGREISRILAERGARVISTDVHADAPEAGLAAGTTYRCLDVTDAGACRRLAEEVDPDVWVNNAGILGAGSIVSQDAESAARVIAVNFTGVVNGTLAAISTMRAKSRGRILNIGSFAAWTPAPGLAVYSGTKHAVRAFSVAAAAELARSGIRISVLCPEGVWTPMLHGAVADGTAVMSFTARRLLDPAEVATAGVELIEKGVLIGSVPKGRALLARAIGSSGSAVVRLDPFFTRAGRAGQKRMRERLSSGDR